MFQSTTITLYSLHKREKDIKGERHILTTNLDSHIQVIEHCSLCLPKMVANGSAMPGNWCFVSTGEWVG